MFLSKLSPMEQRRLAQERETFKVVKDIIENDKDRYQPPKLKNLEGISTKDDIKFSLDNLTSIRKFKHRKKTYGNVGNVYTGRNKT